MVGCGSKIMYEILLLSYKHKPQLLETMDLRNMSEQVLFHLLCQFIQQFHISAELSDFLTKEYIS